MNQPTRRSNFSGSSLVIQIQLNMFRASSCPSSGAHQLQQKPLVYRWNVVVVMLLAVIEPARTRPTALLPPRSNGKPETATAVIELPMMGMRMPETCWAVFQKQVINLKNCCIWLVDSYECMTMHGLANPKFKNCELLLSYVLGDCMLQSI
jgi:hypothetical protein